MPGATWSWRVEDLFPMRTDASMRAAYSQRRIHEVLAEASRRLASAADPDEIRTTACDAALALLAPDPHAGSALLLPVATGFAVVTTRGTLAVLDSSTIGLGTLPELVLSDLAKGDTVRMTGGPGAFAIEPTSQNRGDDVVLAPIMSRGHLRGVLAAAATSIDSAVHPVALLASIISLALHTARRSWTEAAIEEALDIVVVLEPDGTIRSANAAVKRYLGLTPAALVGTRLVDLAHPEDTRSLLDWLRHARGGGDLPALDLRCRKAAGGWGEFEATATTMLDVPDVRGIVLNLRDVRERNTLAAELTHSASHDPLTGLANRAELHEQITISLLKASRSGLYPGLLLIDLDDFSAVNAGLGHQEADRLLVIVAERLRRCARTGDLVARLGSGEFVVLISEGAGAENLAERILATLSSPVTLAGTRVQAHASIGIRIAAGPDRDVDQLLRDADLAMHAAKTSGKATWRCFQPDMHEQAQRRRTLRSELHSALETDEFVLFYQPIVEVDSGRVSGFEALVRWQHPRRGLVGPDEFIAETEQTDLIIPLGAWVLQRACAVAVTMCKAADRELVMSVNVSLRQLGTDDFIEVVRSALDESGLPASALCLEITESVLAEDAALVERLRILRFIGVHLAIDDFGTGFSSYSQLQDLPFDTIKIDRSFVERLGPDERTPALARGIIRMSQAIGLRTVAEGVETDEQHKALQELDCPFAQGYLYARPLAESKALALLEATD
jgi:diguanylate cyclase (GGDEF)-like protein/PAS domain S-box-containing protein